MFSPSRVGISTASTFYILSVDQGRYMNKIVSLRLAHRAPNVT